MIVLLTHAAGRCYQQCDTSVIPDNWQIHEYTPINDNDYGILIRDHWGLDDLIIWEGDVLATKEQMNDLISCSERVCFQAYEAHVYDNHRSATIISTDEEFGRCHLGGCDFGIMAWNKQKRLRPGDEWATSSGLGLIRISKQAQQVKLPILGPYWGVDGLLTSTLSDNGFKIHVHTKTISKHSHADCVLYPSKPSKRV